MKIEVISKGADVSLNGSREIWFHVLSNEAHDWPSIEKELDSVQRSMLNNLGRRAMSYFPHSPTSEERETHGYLFEDWFVWSAISAVRKTA